MEDNAHASSRTIFKGCDSICEVKYEKVASNGTSALHSIICTRTALKNYNNNDLRFKRHDFDDNFCTGQLA